MRMKGLANSENLFERADHEWGQNAEHFGLLSNFESLKIKNDELKKPY